MTGIGIWLAAAARLPRYGSRLIALVAVLVAGTAGAQNLLPNPNFNPPSTLVPWTVSVSQAPDDPAGSGTTAWAGAQDVGNSPASGSAQVQLDAAPALARAAVGIRQCIAFASTTVSTANYGARFKVPVTGNPGDGSVATLLEVRFFSDSACATPIANAGGMQGRVWSAGVPDDVFWYATGDAGFILPPGTVAQSAQVRATATRLADGAAVTLNWFDDIFLALNGSTPVVLQSFDVD